MDAITLIGRNILGTIKTNIIGIMLHTEICFFFSKVLRCSVHFSKVHVTSFLGMLLSLNLTSQHPLANEALEREMVHIGELMTGTGFSR